MNSTTRWNSSCEMIRSFLDLKKAIDLIERDLKGSETIRVDDVNILGEVVNILDILCDITTHWQTSTFIVITEVYPVLFALIQKLQSSLTELKEEVCLKFISCLIDEIKQRFCMDDSEFLGKYSVHSLSSALDPRFKDLSCFSNDVKKMIWERVMNEMSKSKVS